MRARSVLAVIVVSILTLSACGDDDAVVSTSQTSPTAPPGPAPSTTVTTSAPTTTPSSTNITDPVPDSSTTLPTGTTPSTAADALADFFQEVAALDAEIRAAADLFNATYDAEAATVSGGATAAIDALDVAPVVSQIRPGLSPEVETAILGVLSDLQSRVAALQGATRMLNGDPSTIAFVLDCLANGADSVARFAADVDSAMTLAALESAPMTVPPDSTPAGVLAVRVEAIRSMNFGCESCGGVAYTDPFPVDWEERTVLDGVGFEASFDGVGWQILIYAC